MSEKIDWRAVGNRRLKELATPVEAHACPTCGSHKDEERPWLVRIYRAVEGSKPVHAIYLPRLAQDVEAMAERLRSFEDEVSR